MSDKKTFKDLGLSAKVLEAISSKGFEEPTAIQEITIPVMLRDDINIIAQAQTGTGKTAAFGLPLIEMIDTASTSVQALILVPTRELAIQVSEEINSLRGKIDLRVVPIYGGQSIDQQLRRLKRGVHVIVGTPGRVIDHLNRKTLKFENIEHLILDEADEMLNMGFIDDIEEIMTHTNPDKRTLLFSATMPNRIKDLAKKYLKGYEHLVVKQDQLTSNLTEQIYFEVKSSDRFEALCRIIDIEESFYGMIFCRTKSDTDSLVSHLNDRGYDAEPIHGDISQAQRERTLDNFKKQRINIMVATDVAARGIDVNNLTHVINYSLPQDPESYVHRIGRTGRAGKIGTAITFITPSEYKKLMFIQRIAKADIKKSQVPKVEEIIKVKTTKINLDLAAVIEAEADEYYVKWAKKLIKESDPEVVLAAILKYSFEEELSPDAYQEIRDVRSGERDGRGGDRGGDRGGNRDFNGGNRSRSSVDLQGKARLFVALGKQDKITASKLVELITSRVSIKSKEISGIEVLEKFSFITVPFAVAEDVIVNFKEKGQRPLISHVKNSKG